MSDAAVGDLLVTPPPDIDKPVELSSLTHLQALDVLMSGRALARKVEKPFGLSETARKALAFYATPSRRGLWDSPKRVNVQDAEIEELLKALDGAAPTPSTIDLPDGQRRPRWRLVGASMVQFGGLHAHCDEAGHPPPSLPLTIDRDIVLLIGPNGAGKSQIAKALSWGLTGQVPRSHDEPIGFETLINHYKPLDATDAGGFPLPTIVPFPGRFHLTARRDEPLLATSVELTFEGEGNGDRMVLRRSLVKTKGGFGTAVVRIADDVEHPVTGVAAALGVSELALEASVLTMARLPFIRLEGANALTRGVAELTGIAPLKQLGERIRDHVARWLKSEYPKKRREELRKLEPRFRDNIATLGSALEAIQPPISTGLPTVPVEADGGAAFAKAFQALDTALTEREAQARRIVREATGIDLEPTMIDALLTQVRHALALCRTDTVGKLLDRVLEPWRVVTIDDGKVTQTLIASTVDRAHAFARIDADRKTAARLRLYAGLRSWAASNQDDVWPMDNCPVCATPLAGKMDLDLATEIRDAMAEVNQQEAASHVDADAWNRAARAHLDETLPANVKRLADRSSGGPLAALRDALTGGISLTGHLSGLATKLKEAVAAVEAGFPSPMATAAPALPEPVADGACAQRLAAVATAVAQAEWLRGAGSATASLRRLVEETTSEETQTFNLFRELSEIERVLAAHQPLKTARDALNGLKGLKVDWDAIHQKIRRAEAARDEVASLEGLVGLVETEVGRLMDELHDRTDTLCGRMYERTNTAGPDLDRVNVNDGALKRRALFDGMVGDGAEVLNASRDRAWLFAFAIALLERIRERDGGLSLLLLDDPQALFDEANQRTLATGLGTLPADGTHPVIVTFNRHFAAALGRNAKSGAIASFDIVPRSSRGLRATIRPLITELERAKTAWKKEDQDHRCVVRYCAEARDYLERAVCDLLWSSRKAIDGSETLQILFNKLESLAKQNPPYDMGCFQRLITHLAWKDEKIRDAINWSHHYISEDLKPLHAEHLEKHLDDIIGLIEACQTALDRMLTSGRTPTTQAVAILPARPFTRRSFPVHGALAARDRVSTDDSSTPAPVPDLELDPERHALFVAGAGLSWLRPLCEPGDVLVVEREANTTTGALSVVWDGTKAFAGWLRRLSGSGAILLEGNPDLSFIKDIDPGRYAIHPVAGILFKAATGNGELISACEEPSLLAKIKAAVPIVTGRSAEPLLRVGGAAFIGAPLEGWPSEKSAMAVRLTNGEQVLKRLGRRLDGAGRVRVLDNLGLSGESLVARLPGGESEEFTSVPEVEEIAPLLGVWLGGMR